MQTNNKWIVLSSTSLAVLLATLNSGTLIIALPELMRALHASLISIMWVVMIYNLATSVLLLNVGRLSDMIGRKNLYNLGFAIFTLASLLCSFSANAEQLIFYRALQGIGGSLLMGIGTALITDAFPGYQRGMALGINAMIAAVGQMIGPIAGGFLVGFGWKWVFLFNVPIGLIGTLWSYFTLKETIEKGKTVRFDIPGTLLFLTGIVSLLVVLTFGGIYGWVSLLTVVLSIFAVVCILGFLWVEKRSTEPLLDLALFKNRVFSMNNLAVLFNSMARLAVTFLLTFYFQGAKGYNALQAGIMLTPMAASMFLVAPVSGWLSDRYEASRLCAFGLAVSCIGLIGLAAIGLDTPYWQLIIWMSLIGGGSGLFNSPNTNAIMGTVPKDKRGVAAGTRSLLLNLGMTISIALALDITTNSMSRENMMKLFADQKISATSAALGGFVHGIHNAFLVSAVFTFLAVVASLVRDKKALAQS